MYYVSVDIVGYWKGDTLFQRSTFYFTFVKSIPVKCYGFNIYYSNAPFPGSIKADFLSITKRFST